MRKIATITILVAICLSMAACSDNELKKASKSMEVLATTIGEVQKNTELAYGQNILDKETADKIMEVCNRINVAGKQTTAILRGVEKLDPDSRKNIILLLTPISESLDPVQIEFVAGIKNKEVRQKLEGGLVVARSLISSIQLIVASN